MDTEKIRDKMFGSRKAILLTLLTIVLFVLMLGEVVTYVVININYNTLIQSSSLATNQAGALTLVDGTARDVLANRLHQAVGALANFESSPTERLGLFVNNTPYFFQSLINNSTLYGIYFDDIGGLTYGGLANAINSQLRLQGVNVTIVNGSVRVYQTSATVLNATYTAYAIANTTTGVVRFPISVSASQNLSGESNLAAAQRDDPAGNGKMQILSSYPKAVLIGNQTAGYGTTSPFMFDYGYLVIEPNSIACSGVPAQFQNANFILATANAVNIPQNDCGMAGLVTITPNTVALAGGAYPQTAPYLVYSAGSQIFNALTNYNNTRVLLDGSGLSLLDISRLRSAILGNSFGYQYYVSNYLPSYLDQAQGSFVRSNINGLFSFQLMGWPEPYLGGSTSNYMAPTTLTLNGPYTISAWFNTANSYAVTSYQPIASSRQPNDFSFDMALCGSGASQCGGAAGFHVDIGNGIAWLAQPTIPFDFANYTWYNEVVTVGTNSYSVYLNGNKVANGIYPSNTPDFADSTHQLTLGSGLGGYFRGGLENVELYNAMLGSAQVQQIYLGGITSWPTPGNSMVAWWPLSYTTNDEGSFSYNLVGNTINQHQLNDYYADPIYQISRAYFNTSTVDGVLNCMNPTQCTNKTQQHFYLGGMGLQVVNGTAINESTAFGLGSAVMPRVVSLAAGGYIQPEGSLPWMTSSTQSFTYSLWIYPTSSNGVIIDEQNYTIPFHHSMLELVDGALYYRTGAGCTAGPSIPLNTWTNVGYTWNASTSTYLLYADGVLQGSTSGSRTAAGSASVFEALGQSDTTNCGSGKAYTGLLSEYKLFNQTLAANEMRQLYLNNTIIDVPANEVMTLSQTYDGNANTTQEPLTDNYGAFYTGGVLCTVSNSVAGLCGVTYVPG